MAAHDWRSHRPLKYQLIQDHAGFDYYQLVRLSRQLLSSDNPAQSRHDLDKRLRFRADLSARFSGFEVSQLDHDRYRQTVTLKTPNYCIAGAAAPLPAPYVEWLQGLSRNGDNAMGDFLDIFNQRLHLWRWNIKSQLHPGLHNGDPDNSDYAQFLSAFIGLSDPNLVKDLPIPRRALLGFAGLLADGRRSAAAISQTLAQILGAGVRLEPMIGRWLSIDKDQRNRLGLMNTRLGEDCVIGRRWFDSQAAIELHVDALPWSRVCPLLPGGKQHTMLRKLLRLLTERRVDVYMVFKVISQSAPTLRISKNHPETPTEKICTPRLGYSSVLGKRFAQTPTRDIRFLMPAFGAAVGPTKDVANQHTADMETTA